MPHFRYRSSLCAHYQIQFIFILFFFDGYWLLNAFQESNSFSFQAFVSKQKLFALPFETFWFVGFVQRSMFDACAIQFSSNFIVYRLATPKTFKMYFSSFSLIFILCCFIRNDRKLHAIAVATI